MDYYSPDNWHVDVTKTLSAEKLQEIEQFLENKGYIAVLHSHFCGARGPTPSAYDDFDQFKDYLAREVKPGDIIDVWPFPSGDCLFSGKVPNEKDEVPKKGAY
jgi:hypothetical protein